VKALILLAALFGFAPMTGAPPSQSLFFVLNADNAATQRLAHYRASAPIAVHVAGDASKFDAMTITAKGPDGTAIRAPLARSGSGFEGALRLVTPGAWTVALTTQLGSVSNAIDDVPLDVEPARSATLAGYAGFALAFLLTIAGIAIIVRRRAFAR
jgi:hypothetical protein